MNDRFTPSINDLSGALTLPLISRLFAEYQSIEKMDVLYYFAAAIPLKHLI